VIVPIGAFVETVKTIGEFVLSAGLIGLSYALVARAPRPPGHP
jgi:hypothetical protein